MGESALDAVTGGENRSFAALPGNTYAGKIKWLEEYVNQKSAEGPVGENKP